MAGNRAAEMRSGEMLFACALLPRGYLIQKNPTKSSE
jgi:hypothetical protein